MAAVSYPTQTRTRSLKPLFYLALIILLAMLIHRAHAVLKHGLEAVAVRNGCDNDGFDSLHKSRSYRTPNKFFELCRTEDGWWGVRIREWSQKKCAWIEKTSFRVGDGTYGEAWAYVTARAKQASVSALHDYAC